MAGILTPGGPLVSVPIMVVFYNGGAALSALVCYMTSWSLFGFQRILAWELPVMGPRFLVARVLPTLVFRSSRAISSASSTRTRGGLPVLIPLFASPAAPSTR